MQARGDHLTPDRIRAVCAVALRNCPAPRISSVVSLPRGWETENTAFTLEFGPPRRRRREDLVIRIYPGDDGAGKSVHEYQILTALRRAGYPVPEPKALVEGDSLAGGPSILMERIHGVEMWGLLTRAQSDEQAGLLDQFCRLLVDLHLLDWRGFLDDPAIDTTDARGWIGRDLARFRRFAWSLLPGSGFGAALDWLEARADRFPCPHPAVVHWDFHPGNVLVREDGRAVVIDWTGGTVTDPRLDLAWTRLLMGVHGRPDWPGQVLAGYERHSGTEIQGIEFFDAAMAVRRLFDVVASLGVGARRLGMRPGAAAEMRRALPALRQVYDLFRQVSGLRIVEVEVLLDGAF